MRWNIPLFLILWHCVYGVFFSLSYGLIMQPRSLWVSLFVFYFPLDIKSGCCQLVQANISPPHLRREQENRTAECHRRQWQRQTQQITECVQWICGRYPTTHTHVCVCIIMYCVNSHARKKVEKNGTIITTTTTTATNNPASTEKK